MAFFGEDGLQRQLKQAQRDLMTKDGQIASMHAVTKEKDETIKKLRSEVERVREENDEMSRARPAESSASGADTEERKRLLAQVRDTQNALDKANMECKQLKEEARLNSIQLHNNRMGTSPTLSTFSQASSSGGRRRSTSLSTDTRVKDLEAELKTLREAAGSPAAEIDGLKTQLANVRRDLNKSINEKMALEARARKDVEAVRSQLDDANFELDAMRRDVEDGGSVSKKEVDRQRKTWEGERLELQNRSGKLESELRERQTEVDCLRSVSEEVARLTEQLDQERQRNAQAANKVASPLLPDNTAEISRLNGEIDTLHAEVAAARMAQRHTDGPTNNSSSSSDLGVRRLQRQLEKAQRDIEALEQSLDQSEEENQALRTRVPLPGSPSLRADDGRVVQLEADNNNLRSEINGLQNTITKLRAELEELKKTTAGSREWQSQAETLRTELEQKDALLTEAESRGNTLSDQLVASGEALAQAQSDFTKATAELSSSSARLTDVQADLQTASTRTEEIEQALSRTQQALDDHEARAAELRQSLENSNSLVAELQARPSTTSLEAELSDIRATSQQLRKEQIDSETALTKAHHEKDEMVDVSSRLTLEIDVLNEKIKTLDEALDEAKDTTAAARKELDQMTNEASTARSELDDVRDQLEAAESNRVSLEAKISGLQEVLSNRSTESEADARDTELFQLRTELDSLRSALQDKEQDLEREVRLLTFTSEQDQKAAAGRISALQSELKASRAAVTETESSLRSEISTLQAEVMGSKKRIDTLSKEASALSAEFDTARTQGPSTTAHSTPDRVGLLYAKIQSLRAERDELRQSLSFAQNESRFTISAAQADRQSALEELQKVKSDISSQTALQASLESEISVVRSQLLEKETKLEETKALFADTTVDRGDIDDKIAQFENDASAAKAKQEELVRQLQESQQTIIELNHAMVLMRSNTDTDKRHRKISMDRKAEMSMITEASTGIVSETGTSGMVSFGASRRPGHTRTRSEMAALILPDQAQMSAMSGRLAELETEVKALSARLERRHATISHLQRENEKLKMAQELNKESADDFEELMSERDTIQAALTERSSEVEHLRLEIGNGKKAIEAHVAKMAELEAVIASSRAEASRHESSAADLSHRLEDLEKEIRNVRQESTIAINRAEVADDLASESASALASSEIQVRDLVLGLVVQRGRLVAATRAWRCASRGLRSRATALDKATAQIDAFDAERAYMSQQLEAHSQRGKALDTADENVHDLETQLEALRAVCDEMTEELEVKVAAESDMAAKVAALQKDREQDGQAAQAMAEMETALVKARETIHRLETEIVSVRQELAGMGAGKTELETALQGEIDDLKKHIGESERATADQTARVEDLTGRLAQTGIDAAATSAAHDATLESSRAELSETQKAMETAQHELGESRSTCDGLRDRLRDVETQLENAMSTANQRTGELEASLAELQQRLGDDSARESELQAMLNGMNTRHDHLTAEVADLTAKLASATLDTDAQQAKQLELSNKVSQLALEAGSQAGIITEKTRAIQEGTQQLEQLQEALTLAKERSASASVVLEERSAELSDLRAENARLQAAIAESRVEPDVAESSVHTELRDRITELETSLLAKTEEVDEADDRTREILKVKVKLEKKIAKLTRQLGEKDTETTKSRSKVLAVDPNPNDSKPAAPIGEMALPSVPAPLAHQRTPSGVRTPLMPVSQRDPSAQVPANTPTSLKRHRDVEVDEKPLPAEAIMLPPAAPLSSIIKKTTPARTSFTPKRNISAGSENARTLYGTTAANTAENRTNIFAPRS